MPVPRLPFKPNRGALAGLTLIVAFVLSIMFLAEHPGPDSNDPAPGGGPEHGATATDTPSHRLPTPSPTSSPTPSPREAIPKAAEDRAAAGIRAYTQHSYRDASFDSWKHRLAAVSTDTYMASLAETFGTDDQARNEWATVVVPTKRETRTTVLEIELDQSGVFDNNGDFLTFLVTYQTAVRSTDTADWTNPASSLSQWVTVTKQTEGSWLVNDIHTSPNRT